MTSLFLPTADARVGFIVDDGGTRHDATGEVSADGMTADVVRQCQPDDRLALQLATNVTGPSVRGFPGLRVYNATGRKVDPGAGAWCARCMRSKTPAVIHHKRLSIDHDAHRRTAQAGAANGERRAVRAALARGRA